MFGKDIVEVFVKIVFRMGGHILKGITGEVEAYHSCSANEGGNSIID